MGFLPPCLLLDILYFHTMHGSTSNVLKEWFLHTTMAKRLSKALRGKRRWVGFECSAEFEDRSSLKHHLATLWESFGIKAEIKLMDFHSASSPVSSDIAVVLDSDRGTGYGVLQVPHSHFSHLRSYIEADDSINLYKVQSYTSSGKIRLVRERMGMPKPPRKR